jgi:hypothetical protein
MRGMHFLQLVLLAVLLLLAGDLQAQCKPTTNHHCVTIDGFAYQPNLLTVVEGDTVQFEVSAFHPLRQVLRAFPSTTPQIRGLGCSDSKEPCIKLMDASVIDPDGLPIFHYICTNHIKQVMRGDVFILPQLIFRSGFDD